MKNNSDDRFLTRPMELVLALLTGTLVANVYYIHPIISEVAQDFAISAATIGLAPALSQIALALGILLLLPLGDRYSNRTLLILFSIGQCLSLAIMAFSSDFFGFLIGSTLLGFCTIGPYLLPAYASRRVSPARLGVVTATLGVGSACGILVARIVAGQVAEHFDWRLIYMAAAALMIAVTGVLPFVLEGRSETKPEGMNETYQSLLFSVLTLMLNSPRIAVSAGIQALSLGIFLSVWLALALHLTSPEMGYGVDVVGYLGIVSLVALLTTPRIGVWADQKGAEEIRFRLNLIQLCGLFLLYLFGGNLWLLLLPIVIMNALGPALDVTGRMTTLAGEPATRNRLLAGFFFVGFTGGGMASWATTAVYETGGWNGSLIFIAMLASISTLLSWREATFANLVIKTHSQEKQT